MISHAMLSTQGESILGGVGHLCLLECLSATQPCCAPAPGSGETPSWPSDVKMAAEAEAASVSDCPVAGITTEFPLWLTRELTTWLAHGLTSHTGDRGCRGVLKPQPGWPSVVTLSIVRTTPCPPAPPPLEYRSTALPGFSLPFKDRSASDGLWLTAGGGGRVNSSSQ